jgi:hypothetical protein
MTIIQIEVTRDGVQQVIASGFEDGAGRRDALRLIDELTPAIDSLSEAARSSGHGSV